MASLLRRPAAAAAEKYDLIVVGGGIYGAMLLLEAARRGISTLLLEKDDFGGRTSYNSLRIVHGGFRYLQSFDLRRFFESVAERRWFLQTFPRQVETMPCLMPLYGEGLRSPAVLRFALLTNDLLSRQRNQGVRADRFLPSGHMLSRAATRALFPAVRAKGLQGAAAWYDAGMSGSQRIIIETLRGAASLGAVALNYVRADELLVHQGTVRGVVATDRESGQAHEYRAARVINAAGPWCRTLAAKWDRDEPALFRRSIAWNILFDRAPLAGHALAVSPPGPRGKLYFLRSANGMLLGGTGHEPAGAGQIDPLPTDGQIAQFLAGINAAVPGLALCTGDIHTVYAGFLPATAEGGSTLTVREVIHDHAARGGPRGLHSVSGVKFTTARLVAEKTLTRVFPQEPRYNPPASGFRVSEFADHAVSSADLSGALPRFRDDLQRIVTEEAVQHLDDLVFRRTAVGDHPHTIEKMAPELCRLFPWDPVRRQQEIARVRARLLARRADGFEQDGCERSRIESQ